MCSIVGSFNIDTVKMLAKLNEYRGTHSHSWSIINSALGIVSMKRDFGALPIDQLGVTISKGDNEYMLCHQQAPTTENKDSAFIHPAAIGAHRLWHNGIIKAKALSVVGEWDTMYLLRELIRSGFDTLSNIDGTFACVYYRDDGEVFVFRNEISPLFIDEDLIISSTKFDGSNPLPPNKVYHMDFQKKIFLEVASFTTKENPYWFGDLIKEKA